MEIEVRGPPHVSGAALFVSNHISYLDVTAIGSVVDGTFVACADLQDWAMFGFLARLQRTIFFSPARGMRDNRCWNSQAGWVPAID